MSRKVGLQQVQMTSNQQQNNSENRAKTQWETSGRHSLTGQRRLWSVKLTLSAVPEGSTCAEMQTACGQPALRHESCVYKDFRVIKSSKIHCFC
jgi:hypothetical protein